MALQFTATCHSLLIEHMRRGCGGGPLERPASECRALPSRGASALASGRRPHREWDHTVGKGVIASFCDVYIVQNRTMEDDLARYHGIPRSESP